MTPVSTFDDGIKNRYVETTTRTKEKAQKEDLTVLWKQMVNEQIAANSAGLSMKQFHQDQ
nr:hypothetical protein [Pedobacter panaciterrae]